MDIGSRVMIGIVARVPLTILSLQRLLEKHKSLACISIVSLSTQQDEEGGVDVLVEWFKRSVANFINLV